MHDIQLNAVAILAIIMVAFIGVVVTKHNERVSTEPVVEIYDNYSASKCRENAIKDIEEMMKYLDDENSSVAEDCIQSLRSIKLD